MQATVTSVTDRKVGSTLLTQAGTTLTVEDPEEFEGAGQLQIGDEVRDYELVNGELIIASTLTETYVEDDPVLVYPLQVERIAYVIEPGGEEEIEAVVPHALHGLLHPGTREELAEEVICEIVGGELQVVDVIAKVPEYEGIIRALGQIFPAAQEATPELQSRLSWEDTDGEVIADIAGSAFGLDGLVVTVGSDDATRSVFGIGRNPDDDLGQVFTSVPRPDDPAQVYRATIIATNDVADTDWSSSFVKKAGVTTSGDVKALDAGQVTVPTNGQTTAPITVAHDLDRVPTGVVVTVNTNESRAARAYTWTDADFIIRVEGIHGGSMGSDTDVSWIAYG